MTLPPFPRHLTAEAAPLDIVVEPETADPWTHHVLAPGMTSCVLRSEPGEQEARDGTAAGAAMSALLRALVHRDEAAGHAWVVHVSGPADEVDTVVREAGRGNTGPADTPGGGSSGADHATFVLQPGDRAASDLIGLNRGRDRVIALLGVRADRADYVATALEHGRDADAVAAADVLITQQPRLGRSTVARRAPSGAVHAPHPAGTALPRAPDAAVLGLPREARRRPGVLPLRPRLGVAVAAVVAVAVAAWGSLLLAHQKSSRPPAARIAPAASSAPTAHSTPAPSAPAVVNAIPIHLPVPLGRLGAATAVDAVRGEAMLFGGSTSDGRVLDDTWTFNGSRWTEPSPPRSPPARRGAVATWDPSISEVVVFGGIGPSGISLDDTWIWDGKVWKNLLPTRARPPAGIAAGLTFDTARQELVLVTSGRVDPARPGAVAGETWTWAGTTWGRLSTRTSPVLTGPAIVTYDATMEQTILVDVKANTTWSFDGKSWTQRLPNGLALDPNEVTHAAYDAATGMVVLVQDGPPGATASATWTFDGATWHLSAATAAPPDIGSLTPDPVASGVLALAGDASATDLGLLSRLTGDTWGPGPAP